MNIAVIGTGYVGLITGICLAFKGHKVTTVDINQSVVEMINSQTPHIYEEGLKDLLQQVIKSKRFRATANLKEALNESEIAIIAVGTPSKDGKIDLNFVERVVADIGNYIKENRPISVLIKSTVIPGTTDGIVKTILERTSGLNSRDIGL